MSHPGRAALTLVILGALSAAGLAGTVEYDPGSITATAFVGTGNVVDWAQTFTVDETGTLTSIEVKIQRHATAQVDDPLLLDIRETASGTPQESDSGGGILFSQSIAAADVGTTLGWHVLSGLNVSVTSGDVLAIALRSDDDVSGAYQWGGTNTDDFSGGSAFLRLGSTGTWGTSGSLDDLAFRAHITAIPLPAAAWTGLALLGALGAIRRVRRRR